MKDGIPRNLTRDLCREKRDFAQQVTCKIGAKCLKFTESLHLLSLSQTDANAIKLTSKDTFNHYH